MYRFSCETCGEAETVDGLDAAQELFNDHAKRRHEVEITKVEPTPDADASASAGKRSVDD